MTPDEREAFAAQALSRRIRHLLARHPPGVQGGALADLLSLWLAGHRVPGDSVATVALRDALLEAHIEAVRQLIAPSEREIASNSPELC
jgi:hypothetical protein